MKSALALLALMTDRLSAAFRRTTYSFRRLDPQEAAAIRPLRIRVVTVGPGETLQSLAARRGKRRAKPDEGEGA